MPYYQCDRIQTNANIYLQVVDDEIMWWHAQAQPQIAMQDAAHKPKYYLPMIDMICISVSQFLCLCAFGSTALFSIVNFRNNDWFQRI